MSTCGSSAAMGEMSHNTRTLENVPEHFYALLRYQFRCRVCFTSSPFTSIANSSERMVTLRASFVSGHRKRPFSSRFAHTHNPLPSHTKAFSRVFGLLVNKNKCPLNGSCPK